MSALWTLSPAVNSTTSASTAAAYAPGDNVLPATLVAMDAKRAVDGLLQRLERDPELSSMAASVREWIPLIAAIVAPGEQVEPGELPHEQIAQLLDRVGEHWQAARQDAGAEVPTRPTGWPR